MNNQNLPIENDDAFKIKLKINVLKSEIEQIQIKLHEFESVLRNFVLDDMIEEQELMSKYRNFQKEKKAKRLAQKKRGKNYKEPDLPIIKKIPSSEKEVEESKELKRLYRETMLLVHPDRFQENTEEAKKATEVTSRLVEIYQSGNLKELQMFHAHIVSGNEGVLLKAESQINSNVDGLEYLQNELKKFEDMLVGLKNKHTYKVLETYERPIDFAQELKDYYKDRIEKLKKRTRKVK
jgi:hypothetical protein